MNNDSPIHITLLFCENSVNQQGLDQYCREEKGYMLKTICLPCSGKVDIPYLIKAIETGADGVLLITCKTGECHYLQGNLRAKKRIKVVDSLLEEAGMRMGHVRAIEAKDDKEVGYIIREIEDFKDRVMELKREGVEVTGEVQK